ncbi:EAL domain-containing protein [Bacillus paranthracis]|uniref:sensor domain-containing protein n=1 Tax=Bacillus cereus group TaxID=86661 RepID=UPI0022E2D047|nr:MULTISPECIES: GGDEF domain-containing phosphodiesterase [Bacillus cereus group]MBL3847459.1 EAL domain-containing protein [Bacillus cereus]MDA1893754.1 EAL domain-containing protein [Bacillus cereus group sp. BY11-1LC]MDA2593078.1 EAL domain-containing protein [Bacillus cereus group sp. Bc065]MDK7443145.1 EAL domain-containing protein [Bacillus paranthracis]MDK7459220.1 EAL domain-containing protein [Bacillus paranthracis]
MKEQYSNQNTFLSMIDMDLIRRGLLHAIQDLVFIVKVIDDEIFKYIYVNKLGMDYAKLSEECYGKTFAEVLPEDTAEILQVQYAKVASEAKAHTFCDVVSLPKGELHYESSLNPVFDEEGVCQFIICITRDITAQIEEKMEIEEKQMLFKSLLEYNNDSIISIDSIGRITYANPATYEIFGYRFEELNNKFIFEFINKEYEKDFQIIFKEAMQGRAKQIVSKKYVHKEGYELYISLRTIPIIVNGEIVGVYIVTRDVTKQVLNEMRTEYLAYYDQLTGLMNRISCTNKLNDFLNEKVAFAFIFIDLDEFHLINDTFGHKEGDKVLQKVTECLSSFQIPDMHLFREHDDQFVMLIENITKERVEVFAKSIQKKISEHFVIEEEDVYLSASIGIVMAPTDGEDEKILFQRVDAALEKAKEKGKGHYHFYGNGLDCEREKRFIIENQLHRAIEKNEFFLYYQPQMNIETKKIASMEALIRWENKELGFVSPNQFIPLAERTGFIIKLDEWVINEVCRQIREWLNKGYEVVPIAVNISARHFRSITLIEMITRALHKYNVSAHLLAIEVTEGALIHKDISKRVLLQLKEQNLKIHLDDFGTGYSSLSYLKTYPIDTLKIDRSFMEGIHVDERDTNITAAIIHLAHTLELDVIAEGVEKAEQIQFLKEKNVKFVQGYYYSRPLSKYDVENVYYK